MTLTLGDRGTILIMGETGITLIWGERGTILIVGETGTVLIWEEKGTGTFIIEEIETDWKEEEVILGGEGKKA